MKICILWVEIVLLVKIILKVCCWHGADRLAFPKIILTPFVKWPHFLSHTVTVQVSLGFYLFTQSCHFAEITALIIINFLFFTIYFGFRSTGLTCHRPQTPPSPPTPPQKLSVNFWHDLSQKWLPFCYSPEEDRFVKSWWYRLVCTVSASEVCILFAVGLLDTSLEITLLAQHSIWTDLCSLYCNQFPSAPVLLRMFKPLPMF